MSAPPIIGRHPHTRVAQDAVELLHVEHGLRPSAARSAILHERHAGAQQPFYEMTIPTDMQWCSAVAATDEEMAAMEGLR